MLGLLVMSRLKIDYLSEFSELLEPSCYKWRNILYYGGRASGKSHATAQALLIRGGKRKLRILCTREIQNTIKDSVHKLLADYINLWELPDWEVGRDFIRNTATGTEFIFRGLKHNINEIKSLEGIDIVWVEEAQSITEASLDILAPTIRKEGSQLIFTFNRFNELDPVYVKYVINKPAKTYVKQVNYDVLDNLGLLPDVIKLEIEADRNNPALYAHKWLGEPVSQADNAILDRGAVLEAMQREIEDDGQIIIGVDVARMGDDRTVLTKRKGLKVLDIAKYSKLRTTEVTDRIEQFADWNKEVIVKVDDTGVGGGVTDELMKRGYNVWGINFGGTAMDRDKYPNWISEQWFYFSEIINKIQLPMDSDLLMELTTRGWKQDIKGKRAVEGKNEYKKRGFRSPDIADSVIICFSSEGLSSDDDIGL